MNYVELLAAYDVQVRQKCDLLEARQVLGRELAEARTLIATLRGIITQNIADNEKADKEAYVVQLVKDQAVAALKYIVQKGALGERGKQYALEALAAAGVTL